MVLIFAILAAACCHPPAVATTTDPPTADPPAETPSPYAPLAQAVAALAAGSSAPACVAGQYQVAFERMALVDGETACWANVPVELPDSPVRRSAVYRVDIEACGTLDRASGGGFGHLGAYDCQFRAEKVDRAVPVE